MWSNQVRNLTVIVLCGIFLSACSTTRPADPWKCALAGAGVGSLIGVGVGVNLDDDKTDSSLIGAGAGAAAGALVGFTVCTVMPEAQPPPPPPPPPPVARAPVVKKTVVLPGVHFAFDRAELLPQAAQTLDEVVAELRADPALTVLVEGHTDAVGSDSYNHGLSERRAQSVKSYLVGGGIDAGRIETRGYGESQPIADNDTEAGRAKNRRVEIKELQ